MTFLSVEEARENKDRVLRQVAIKNPAWMDQCLEYLSTLGSFRGTGEDLRILLTTIFGEPSHHNAWGSLIRAAVQKDYITPNGEFQPMRMKSSHGRMTPVYVA